MIFRRKTKVFGKKSLQCKRVREESETESQKPETELCRKRHTFSGCFLVPLFSVLFCASLYIFPGIRQGSDEPFHLARILSLADAIRAGIFPVKIHPQLCYGMGYGVGFFYDNAMLYFPALLIIAGVSLEVAYKLFALLVFILMTVSMYYSCLRLTGNRMVSSLCAAIYPLTNRIIIQLYFDFTIGNFCAAVFLPLAIAGVYIYLRKGNDGKSGLGMFVIGFTGLLYTHAITTLLAFFVCVFIILFNIQRLFHGKKFIWLGMATIYTLMLTAAYWLPMWQQFHCQLLKVKAPWTTEEENVMPIAGVLADPKGAGTAVVIAWLCCILYIIYSLCNRKSKNMEKLKEAFQFWIIGTIFLLLPCWHEFWHLLNTRIMVIQFPARLFLQATVLILFAFAVICSICSDSAKTRKTETFVTACASIAICVCSAYIVLVELYIPSVRDGQINDEIINEVETYSVAGVGAGQEWLPIETDIYALESRKDISIADDGTEVTGSRTNYSREYSFEADLSKEYYEAPVIYYRGYTAVDDKGNTYSVDESYHTGLLKIFMPEGRSGKATIHVSYKGTKYQIMAYAISVIALLGPIIYAAKRRTHKNTPGTDIFHGSKTR